MKNLFIPKLNNVIIRLNYKCKNTCVRFTCMLLIQSTKVPRIIHYTYPPKIKFSVTNKHVKQTHYPPKT